MTDMQAWKDLTGKVLTLGQKVRVSQGNEYWSDWQGEYFITGLDMLKCGKKVNITLGENIGDREADGWDIYDLIAI
jgi:hypothetical protein